MPTCPQCNSSPHAEDCTRIGKRICEYCDSIIGLKEESYSLHRRNGTTAGCIHKEHVGDWHR